MPAFAGMTLVITRLEKIVPIGVHVHDLTQLPIAIPRFHHFLSSDRVVDTIMLLSIYKPGQTEALTEF